MRIIRPSFSFMYLPDGEFILAHLEQAARTCYKSEDKAGPDTARQLLARIVRLGHESVLEHASVTVRIVCDRRDPRTGPPPPVFLLPGKHPLRQLRAFQIWQ